MLAALRTPMKTEREDHDVSHVPQRLLSRFGVMGRGLERRHLTQCSARDDDRPRVFADNGYLSGRLNTTVSCKGQTHWHVRSGRFDERRW